MQLENWHAVGNDGELGVGRGRADGGPEGRREDGVLC